MSSGAAWCGEGDQNVSFRDRSSREGQHSQSTDSPLNDTTKRSSSSADMKPTNSSLEYNNVHKLLSLQPELMLTTEV